MSKEFKVRLGSTLISAPLCFVAALILLGVANTPIWVGLRLFMLLLGLCFVSMLIYLLSLALDPSPILKIGPEGIYYRPFLRRFVPWTDIQSVNAGRYYGYRRRSADGVRSRRGDTIRFDLVNPGAYPHAAHHAPVITMSLVDATIEDVVAAIKANWTGPLTEADLRSS